MSRLATIKAFKIILWLLALSFFKLILFSSFKRVTYLPIHYIEISFLFVAWVSYPFA
jgi:hypothetical protein